MPSYEYTVSFIHQLLDFGAVLNNAAVNNCVQFFMCAYVLSLACKLRSGMTGSYGNSMFYYFEELSNYLLCDLNTCSSLFTL